MHVIPQSYFHHAGDTAGHGCDVGFLRFRGHSQMAKLVSDSGAQAGHQHSRGDSQKVNGKSKGKKVQPAHSVAHNHIHFPHSTIR